VYGIMASVKVGFLYTETLTFDGVFWIVRSRKLIVLFSSIFSVKWRFGWRVLKSWRIDCRSVWWESKIRRMSSTYRK
jgi:hypothetical protein